MSSSSKEIDSKRSPCYARFVSSRTRERLLHERRIRQHIDLCRASRLPHLPRYDEIPSIDLYMDQLVGFSKTRWLRYNQPGEKIITRSMVNNYVKQGVLASAARAKVHALPHRIPHRHLPLKQTFSIAEIRPAHPHANRQLRHARGLRLLLRCVRSRAAERCSHPFQPARKGLMRRK